MKNIILIFLFVEICFAGFQGGWNGKVRANLDMKNFEIVNRKRSWLAISISTGTAYEYGSTYESIKGNWLDCNLVNFTRDVSTFTHAGLITRWFVGVGKLNVLAPSGALEISLAWFKNGEIVSETETTIQLDNNAQAEATTACAFELSTGDKIRVLLKVNGVGGEIMVGQGTFRVWAME